MTVGELISVLQTKPPHLLVVYRCFSEWSLLEADEIEVRELRSPPRLDGWVHDRRPDKPTQEYLTLPGN